MTTFVPTELRWCSACHKDYVTALVAEAENGELTPWQEPCPYCRTAPEAVERRESRTAVSH